MKLWRNYITTVADLKPLSGDLKVTNWRIFVQQFHSKRVPGFEASCGQVLHEALVDLGLRLYCTNFYSISEILS